MERRQANISRSAKRESFHNHSYIKSVINGFLCVRETESTSKIFFPLLLCVSKPLFRPQGSSQPESFINDE